MSRPFVDDVFDAVIDLEAARRDEVLRERCEGHPSVEGEVRQLLRVAPPPSPRLEAGSTFGTYALEEALGSGATATVWRAWDAHLQAWTALKILHPNRGGALDTVLREARAASQILSDHVVRIRTCGRVDEVSFIDMQLCAEYRDGPEGEALVIGQSLADLPAVDARTAARLVAEACRGVEAAHRVGVLHRDLKPANVLVTPVSRRALVTDFGLATACEPATRATRATATVSVEVPTRQAGRTAVIVGTPPFMAPELVRGAPHSRRSDVYALGATLYSLLAGRPPYAATGRHSDVPALDVVMQVHEGPPPPLVVDRRLARIVAHAMCRDGSARYSGAGALADDLERWLADRPTTRDPRPLRPALFLYRQRAVVGTAALLGAMLLASAGGLFALEHRRQALERDVSAAEHRREDAELQASDAERVRADAVADRDAAVAVRDTAVADALAASEARDAARQGQTSAEKRATAEIRARREADTAKSDALVRRDVVEGLYRDEAARRAHAESDLALAQEARAAAEHARDDSDLARDFEEALRHDVEARLVAEEAARVRAEGERDAARAEVERLSAPSITPATPASSP